MICVFHGQVSGSKFPNPFGSQKLSTGIIESRHVPYNMTAESISDFENSEDRASRYILIIKANGMHYSLNLFLIKKSTCFGHIYCPSSGV
jgi:hypothetical protein